MITGRDQQPDGCLDAETLAAWVDGGLDARAAAMAESHVSSCERCREIIALISHTETVPGSRLSVPELPWHRRLRAAWMIPLAASVAAVGLWMIVPANRLATVPPSLQPESSLARDRAPTAPAEAPAGALRAAEPKRQQPAAPAIDQLAKSVRSAPDPSKNKEQKLADRQGAREDRLEERVAAGRPAPPAAAAPAAQALGRMNVNVSPREIASPDPRTRWRLLDGGTVEYTADGGVTWETLSTGVTEQLMAGSSPTTDVCWIVGRGGLVLLTTDGRRWQRVAFPETLDLSGVQATDSRSALVTAADGMLFRTIDGGVSWSRP